jgi:hypothetical protein
VVENEPYRIIMGQRWALDDLYAFPHTFGQTYSFVYCFDSDLEPRDANRIQKAIAEYPWRGGYSYVNIYAVLWNQVPPDDRPVVASIRYSSPGWMDLLLNVDVAIGVAKAVGIYVGSTMAAAKAYGAIAAVIAKINKERDQSRLAVVKLHREEANVLMKLSNELAAHIGFKNFEALAETTENPEVAAKLLMAHYRRLKVLGDFAQEGKAVLPEGKD